MKISNRYRACLDRYLEWENVTTPLRQFESLVINLPRIESGGTTSAAEWLHEWESRGVALSSCAELPLLRRYWRGKAMRDWWSKEIGWLNHHACFIPEEYLAMLGPLPFIELFGREPISRIVRLHFDNRYSNWSFRMDAWIARLTSPGGSFFYYQRDDRDSGLVVLVHLAKLRWFDPLIWRLKRFGSQKIPVRKWFTY